jgi:hypothetical protein
MLGRLKNQTTTRGGCRPIMVSDSLIAIGYLKPVIFPQALFGTPSSPGTRWYAISKSCSLEL